MSRRANMIRHGFNHLPTGSDPIPGIGCCTPSTGGFPDYETGVLATSDLVGYWRLGEGSTPYLDTSGYAPADPADADRVTGTTAMTQDLTPGGLGIDDDGAVQFNAAGSALTPVSGDFLQTTASTDTLRFGFGVNGDFTVACWIRPLASATSWTGAIVSTVATLHSGGPSAVDNGFRLEMTWPSRVVAFTRAPNVAVAGSYPSVPSPSGLTASTWHFVVGTYDGTTLRLYLNGTEVATQADSASVDQTGTTLPQLGVGSYDHGAYSSWFYGGLDEVAIWGRDLTPDEITALYVAGVSGDISAAGRVLTSDGMGGTSYEFPTIEVDPPGGRFNKIVAGTNVTATDNADDSVTFDVDSAPPSGSAGGDLGGTYPNPDVATVDDSVLGSGTPSSSTFLRGDRSWATIPSGDPADDTAVWMPLTTVVGGVPDLVWDADDSLIPTITPI